MPAVPKSYPSYASGQPCGADWNEPVIVTGEIPGKRGFGEEIQDVLAPLPVSLNGLFAAQGLDIPFYDRADEVQVIIADVGDNVSQARHLTRKEKRSLRWLVDHAQAELDAAIFLSNKWVERSRGTWPLWIADTLPGFTLQFSDEPFCGGGTRAHGSTGGIIIEIPGIGGIRCPTPEEQDQRAVDREQVRQHLDWALQHVRCAQYGLTRLKLYRQAVDKWKKSPQAGRPGGLTTVPTPPIGDITAPPPAPFDAELPDTKKLPRPDRVGGQFPSKKATLPKSPEVAQDSAWGGVIVAAGVLSLIAYGRRG